MDQFISPKALAASNLDATFNHNLIHSTLIRCSLYAVFAGLLVKIVIKITKKSKSVTSARYGWPVIGNIVGYSTNPVFYLRQAAAKYGTVFGVNMLLTNTVWLLDTSLNKIYLEAKEEQWSFGDGMGLFLNKVVVPGYFNNLKTFVASLSRGINRKVTLDCYTDIARETSVRFLLQWSEHSHIGTFEHVSKLVHAIIVQCLMGPDFYSKNGEELYGLLKGMEADIGNVLNFILPDWIPHPAAQRLKQHKNRVGEIFAERLREREENPGDWCDAQDYISYTMNDNVTANLKEFFAAHHTLLMFAAHTSTVASISWTILELLKNPALIKSIRQDLLQDSNHLSSPHLQASLKETGRLYSGVSMLRLARQQSTLPSSEVTISEGSVVSISPYLTHRDPAIYPKAEQWYPERWLKEPDLAKRVNSEGKLAYMPFGAGVHRCPGEKLAGIVASTVLGTLVQEYNVQSQHGNDTKMEALDFSKIGSPWLKGDASIAITKRIT